MNSKPSFWCFLFAIAFSVDLIRADRSAGHTQEEELLRSMKAHVSAGYYTREEFDSMIDPIRKFPNPGTLLEGVRFKLTDDTYHYYYTKANPAGSRLSGSYICIIRSSNNRLLIAYERTYDIYEMNLNYADKPTMDSLIPLILEEFIKN